MRRLEEPQKAVLLGILTLDLLLKEVQERGVRTRLRD